MEEIANFKRKKRQNDGVKKLLKNMSKETLMATLEKKKLCNERAMKIVERLIEPGVGKDWLLENLKFIGQCHFQDVVEERAIVKCCGYPLCDKKLTNIPRKQYHISTKYNKVFDITDRKNYCSNICFKAGTFLKDQLLTSPLWLRDFDELLIFELYSTSSTGGQSGVEVDLGNPIPVKLESEILLRKVLLEEPEQERDHSSDEEDNGNYSEIEQRILAALSVNDEGTPNEEPERMDNVDGPPSSSKAKDIPPVLSMPSIEEEEVQKVPEPPPVPSKQSDDNRTVPENTYCPTKPDETHNTPSTPSLIACSMEDTKSICSTENKENTITKKNTSISEDIIDTHLKVNEDLHKSKVKSETKPQDKPERKKSITSSKKRLKPTMHDIVIKIEQTIRSWFTFDTLRFILGDDRLKEMLIEGGAPTDVKSMSQMDPHIYERYSDICRKLNILEIKEAVEDREILKPSKPLPDYEQLKNQTKEIEIKVKTFFKGDAKVQFKEGSKNVEADDDGESRVIPTVDHYAIRATRRKIILDKLNKTLPDIQSALGLSSFHIAPDVKEFIFSLNLTADNILLKPSQWSLAAIVLIKLLCVRDERLNFAFSSTTAQKYVALLLMSYELDMGYLDRLLAWLLNYEYLMTNELST